MERHPKHADRMANGVDPDQTGPNVDPDQAASRVWSWSTLFAPTLFAWPIYPQNLGSLQHTDFWKRGCDFKEFYKGDANL